jgi:hypothetical protein
MSILHNHTKQKDLYERLEVDDREERDVLTDLKDGLDLIFNLKENLERLHPIATDTLITLLSN